MTIARHRERNAEPIPAPGTYLGISHSLYKGADVIGSPILSYCDNGRVCLQERCDDELHQGPPYRQGGPFYYTRLWFERDNGESVHLSYGPPTGVQYTYDGTLAVNKGWDSNILTTHSSYSPSAWSYGSEAWKRFRPTKPKVDLGVFIGELREFPDLFKVGLRRFKDLGGNYLNYQFGWRPFISDIRKSFKTLANMEKTIRFIRKNNGKWIKRGGILKNDQNSTFQDEFGGFYCIPTLSGYLWDRSYSTRQVTRWNYTDKVWFKARMKFYIKDLQLDKADSFINSPLLRRLWGLELSPMLIWNLTPWTWLMDWVTDLSNVYENMSLSGYDNLVAKYAYVMRHRRTVKTVLATQRYKNPITLRTHTLTQGCECKERAAASPFGFGAAGDDSFTLRQMAILAALGLTHFRL